MTTKSEYIVDQLQHDGLKPYASDYQWNVRRHVLESGSIYKASVALGKKYRSVSRSMERLLKAAADRGYAPGHDQTRTTPIGQHVRGVSTLYGPDGKIKLQWSKTQRDGDTGSQLKEFAEQISEEIVPARISPGCCGGTEKSTLAVYPIGDPHFGMLSWGEETGDDFDISIAENQLKEAVSRIMLSGLDSETAVILNLGDFFHSDNLESTTRSSGHSLDTDTRWPKVMRLGARLMVDLVSLALQRHKRVTVKNLIGNHDDQSSVALSLILDAFYRNEPRVTVDISPSFFGTTVSGRTLLVLPTAIRLRLPL